MSNFPGDKPWSSNLIVSIRREAIFQRCPYAASLTLAFLSIIPKIPLVKGLGAFLDWQALIRTGWEPVVTNFLSAVINNAAGFFMGGCHCLREARSAKYLHTTCVYIIKRAGGWGGGGPFLGLGAHWMLVLIDLLQQLDFYGLPSHLWLSQPSPGCWPLAGCSELEWILKQEQAFMLTAKCKWFKNRTTKWNWRW